MKTRVIRTDIFKDPRFINLNVHSRNLYLTLLLNEDVGQSRIYPCANAFLSLYSGLTQRELDDAKTALEIANLALFKDEYVCIVSDLGFIESYYSGPKNEQVRIKQIQAIPGHVLEYFLKNLDALGIGYRESIDTTLNNNIINNKQLNHKLVNNKSEEKSEFLDGPF